MEISIEEAGVISRSEPTPLDVVDAARRDVKGEESTSTEEVISQANKPLKCSISALSKFTEYTSCFGSL